MVLSVGCLECRWDGPVTEVKGQAPTLDVAKEMCPVRGSEWQQATPSLWWAQPETDREYVLLRVGNFTPQPAMDPVTAV